MCSDSTVRKVLSHFLDTRDIRSISQLKTGLIHQSYKIELTEQSFLLQKINTNVFHDAGALMKNIALVTETLDSPDYNTVFETLQVLRTNDDTLYYENESGCWRIYYYKDHLAAYESPVNIGMVKEAGKAFSRFTGALSELQPDALSITIPNFHSLEFRNQQLQATLESTDVDHAGIHDLTDVITRFTRILSPLEKAQKQGKIPTRITHNDTKFNNLLFDNAGIARCVVDLDTVMPGIIHFDVGDCLRTLTPNTPEDEADIDSIELRENYYSAFIEGYTESGWLTEEEINYLPFSAPYMSLIMGIRFLTDYLNHNIYYPINYTNHNLIRARCQLEITRQFLSKLPVIET